MIDYADPRRHASPRPLGVRLTLDGLILIAWIVGGLAAVGGAAMAGTIMMGPLMGGFFGLMMVIMLSVWARCAQAARRRTATLLLGHLEQAVRLNLPLSPMLAAAQRGETAGVASRVSRMRIALEEGSPVGDALFAAAPGVNLRTVEMLNSAERNGHLPEVLGRLYRDEYAEAQKDPSRAGFAIAYALVLVMSVSGVLGLIAVFVMPKFSQIFQDFEIPLPPVTRATMHATANLALPVTVAAAAALLAYCGMALRNLLRQRPADNPGQDLLQRLAWGMPILGRLERDRGLADACAAIADAMEAGRPAPEALAEGQLRHINVVLRQRLAHWAELVASGGSLAESARQAWMPRLLSGLLNTAQPGDIVNVLRFLSRYYHSRFSRLALLLQSALPPLVAILFGALAATAALSIFAPMVRLMDRVNPLMEIPW